MKRPIISGQLGRRGGFSLVEVVIALGLITVGVTAVLALFPTALQSSHSAQDETRAGHIAQSVFGSLVAGATSQFNNVRLPVSDNATPTPAPIDLTASSSPTTPTLYGDNDGKLVSVQFATQNPTTAVYAIFIYTNNAPPGFTTVPPTANQVTVRVAWPANAPANQTFRDYVRIVSQY
jgi:uncharacterized protein (TIGR02598 family)